MKKWTDRMETPIQAELICYDVNGIHIVFGVTKEKALKLFHFSSAPFDAENLCRKPDNWWPMEGMREAQIEESFQLVQVNFSGYNRPYEKHGNKYIVTAPGFMLKFDSISEERNEDGDLLRIVQKDDVTGARVESVMQFYDGLPVARMYNTVTNEGSENQTLEYISSFSYWGIEKEQKEGIPEFISSDDKMSMIVVHNGWQKELTVKKYRFADLGMAQTQPHNYQRTSKTIEITNTGNWSAAGILESLPESSNVCYLLSILYSRLKDDGKAVSSFMRSLELDGSKAYRGRLDPEINRLITTYNLNLSQYE